MKFWRCRWAWAFARSAANDSSALANSDGAAAEPRAAGAGAAPRAGNGRITQRGKAGGDGEAASHATTLRIGCPMVGFPADQQLQSLERGQPIRVDLAQGTHDVVLPCGKQLELRLRERGAA